MAGNRVAANPETTKVYRRRTPQSLLARRALVEGGTETSGRLTAKPSSFDDPPVGGPPPPSPQESIGEIWCLLEETRPEGGPFQEAREAGTSVHTFVAGSSPDCARRGSEQFAGWGHCRSGTLDSFSRGVGVTMGRKFRTRLRLDFRTLRPGPVAQARKALPPASRTVHLPPIT